MVTAVRWPVRNASRALSVTAAAAETSQEVRPGRRPARHRREPVLQLGVVSADDPVAPVDGNAAAVPAGRAHGHLADVREGDGPGLADDLAADVVAVLGADEQA